MRIIAVGLALIVGLASADAAQLRSKVQVEGPLVTLGDLIEGAGDQADIAVFRAPDLGTSGIISARRVIEAAAHHGLKADADGVGSVSVWRVSRAVEAHQIENAVRIDLKRRGLIGEDTTVSLAVAGLREPLHLPAAVTAAPRVRALDHSEGLGEFTAQVTIVDDLDNPVFTTRVRGKITHFVTLPVLTRRINRHEIIGRDDVALKRIEKKDAPDQVLTLADVVGQAATRSMRQGATVIGRDLTAPIVVRRNTIVTMLVRSGRLILSAKGRALSDAAAGDIISVINTSSNRIIEGRVTPSGTIEIDPQQEPVAIAGNASG